MVEDKLELGKLVYESGEIKCSKILKIYFQMCLMGVVGMVSIGAIVQVITIFYSDEVTLADEWLDLFWALASAIYVVPLMLLPVFLLWLCFRPFRESRIYEEGVIICKGKKEIKIPFCEMASIGNPPMSKMMRLIFAFGIASHSVETFPNGDTIPRYAVAIGSLSAPSFVNGLGILKVGEEKWHRFKLLEFNVFYETLISTYDEWYKRYYKLDDYEEFLK